LPGLSVKITPSYRPSLPPARDRFAIASGEREIAPPTPAAARQVALAAAVQVSRLTKTRSSGE